MTSRASEARTGREPAAGNGSGASGQRRLPPQVLRLLEQRRDRRYTRQAILFLLAHPILVWLLRLQPLIATAHAAATLGLGLYWLYKSRNPVVVIPVMGYIAGMEVVWRSAHAAIPWEFGKYSVSFLAIVAILRFGLLRRASKLPLIYFLLLVPSIFVMPAFDREDVAFNLSGPFSLAVLTMFMSTQNLDGKLFKRLLLSTLAPILGLAALATFSTVTADRLVFGGSTKVTSAGIGPNQVSSVLGLGILLALFYVFTDRKSHRLRWFLLACCLWLGAQSALTFSRGGLATTVLALIAGAFFLLQDRYTRGAFLLRTLLIVAISATLLYPALNAVTDGALGERFSSTSLTGRDKIIEADLIAFREHPVLGVGPAGSKTYHARIFRWSSAHTEYSRVLAEHGSAGLLALLVLLVMSARRALQSGSMVSKAFAAAMTCWALLYMFHSAMRLAAPSLIFALGAATLAFEARASFSMAALKRRPGMPPRARRAPSPEPGPLGA